MPITLCFKKRHKVMGHHIKLETYFAGLLERYKVCSLREYHSETVEGKPYTYCLLYTSDAADE